MNIIEAKLKDHVENCCLLDIEKPLLMKGSAEIKIYADMLSNACDTEKSSRKSMQIWSIYAPTECKKETLP